VGALVALLAASASAQQSVQGFAVERFYPSAPGAGWLVMDDLDLHGDLGGAIGLSLGYANRPLRVSDGTNRLTVVSDQAFADVGAAFFYRCFRVYLNIDAPLVITGQGGTLGGYTFSAPSVDLGANPDTVADVRLGADVRIFGEVGEPFRFGLSGQLFVPSGSRADYDTDGGFRGMFRALFAGDAPYFTYAAQLGIHYRPLDDWPTPGSPHGSELLYGVAAGAKLPVGRRRGWAVVVGPELYGASALRSFSREATAFEGLLSGRLEGTRDDRAQVRIKLGVGAGLNAQFGAAAWRLVAGVELFGQRARARPR
jgi:hypothetical protein